MATARARSDSVRVRRRPGRPVSVNSLNPSLVRRHAVLGTSGNSCSASRTTRCSQLGRLPVQSPLGDIERALDVSRRPRVRPGRAAVLEGCDERRVAARRREQLPHARDALPQCFGRRDGGVEGRIDVPARRRVVAVHVPLRIDVRQVCEQQLHAPGQAAERRSAGFSLLVPLRLGPAPFRFAPCGGLLAAPGRRVGSALLRLQRCDLRVERLDPRPRLGGFGRVPRVRRPGLPGRSRRPLVRDIPVRLQLRRPRRPILPAVLRRRPDVLRRRVQRESGTGKKLIAGPLHGENLRARRMTSSRVRDHLAGRNGWLSSGRKRRQGRKRRGPRARTGCDTSWSPPALASPTPTRKTGSSRSACPASAPSRTRSKRST